MKKIMTKIATMAACVTLLAGCGTSGSGAGTAPQTTPAADEAAAQGESAVAETTEAEVQGTQAADEATGGAELKIAIVSSLTGVDDGSYNQNNYEGILSFINDGNPKSTVTPVKEETGDVAACISTVEGIAADYDVIVCDGYQFAGIGSIAEANPDVEFLLVDTDPTDAAGNMVELPNVYAMTFREQEGGFAAGVAAALSTTTGKVAVMNGVAFPSNVNYQYGFMSGVNYANAHYGADAEIVELPTYAGTDVNGTNVGGNYVGSFSDEATGKIVGKALIDAGCDVIFVAAGAYARGAFAAAKEAEGVYIIGCDVDQFDDGADGDRNVVLTSVLKAMDKNNKLQLEKIAAGTFEGKNELLGADTDSTGYVRAPGRCQLTDDAITKIDEAFAKVKSGEVVPASSYNGLTPDAFTGL